MRSSLKLCDSCNSPIVTVKRGSKVSVECSYCGMPYEKGNVGEDYISEEFGDEDEV